MKSKLFKEFIAEQTSRNQYFRRGSAETRSIDAERARQLRQQTQQTVNDYARQQGIKPSDVITQVRQTPLSDIPTVSKPGSLPTDIERAARLLANPDTNWRNLAKPDPTLPPGAVGNVISALPPQIGPIPVRGPATFLRSLITPKAAKPVSGVVPEIGRLTTPSRGVTSQTSSDIAAGIAKADKAAAERAGAKPIVDKPEPSLSKPTEPETNKTSSVSGKPPTSPSSSGGNIEIKTGIDSPGGSVGTDITGARGNKAPTIKQMIDKDVSSPVPPTSQSQQTATKQASTDTLVPTNQRAEPYLGTKPADNVKTSTPANEPSRGYGRGAIALGISGAGVAALNQPPVSSAASQTNPRTNTASTTARPAAPAATAAAPAATAAAPVATAAAPVATAAATAAAPVATAAAPAAPAATAAVPAATAANANSATPTATVTPPVVRTNTAQRVTDLVNQANAETPFRISDQEQKQRELDREQTRANAMDFLSKGNVGINPDAWTDKDKQNLAKMQGQGIQESIQELKKLSGLVK